MYTLKCGFRHIHPAAIKTVEHSMKEATDAPVEIQMFSCAVRQLKPYPILAIDELA